MEAYAKAIAAIGVIMAIIFICAAPSTAAPVIAFESPRHQVVAPMESVNLSFTSNIPITTATFYQDGFPITTPNKYNTFVFTDGGKYHNISVTADGSNMLTWHVTVTRLMASEPIETLPDDAYEELIGGGSDLISEGSASYSFMPITIVNNPNIAGYQASVLIPYQTGMNANMSDIRFYDGDAQIPYWAETISSSTSALVWIPISQGSEIQCRWDIPGEDLSESDGSAVFLFFDDFSGGLSKWTGDTIEGETIGGKLYFNATAATWKVMNTTTAFVAPFVLDGKWAHIGGGAGAGCAIRLRSYSLTQYVDLIHTGGVKQIRHVPSVATTNSDALENRYTIYVGGGATPLSSVFLKNDAQMTASPLGGNSIGGSTFTLYVESYGTTATGIISDWFAVRKFAAVPPSLSVGAAATGGDTAGDWEGLLELSTTPFTDLIGKMFWIVLFLLPFGIMWMKQESMTAPVATSMIVGSIIIGFIPETYKAFIVLMIVMSFAVNFYILSKDRG